MANQMLDLLQQHLGDDNFIDKLSEQIGGADRDQTRAAAHGIVTALSGAAAQTASTPAGASSLLNMLDTDHNGSIFDNLIGAVTGGGQQGGSLAQSGVGIVESLLGGNQNGVVSMISKMAGMDSGKTGNLLNILAPVVLGALGKAKSTGGLDLNGITSLLQGNQQQAQSNPALQMITGFLDNNHDGNIADDLINDLGSNLLGGLFGKK
jgi:hypothetical protein